LRSEHTASAELAPFGFNHPASVSNLIRRAEKHLAQPRQDRNLAARIVETISKNRKQGLTWGVQFVVVKTNWFDPIFVPASRRTMPPACPV
jgi:hypothetical protein